MKINRHLHILFRNPVLAGFLASVFLLIPVLLLVYQRHQLYREEKNRELLTAANAKKDKLDAAFRNSLSATRMLNFVVERDTNISDFDREAARILKENQYIDAVELVRGGTITHVYPLKGNEAAIGYNILEDTLRNKEALKALRQNKLYFAGPFPLKQGDTAIVGRLPIYRNNRFWGFSAVIIKLSTLVRIADFVPDETSPYIFQLSKTNPNSGVEEFFLPQKEQLPSRNTVSVFLPDGEWRIYAWLKNNTWLIPLPLFILGLLLSVTGGFLVWFIARQPAALRKLVRERTELLQRSEEKFRGLVEQNLVGVFILQDRHFRYVNPGMETITAIPRNKLMQGLRIGDIIHEEDLQFLGQHLLFSAGHSPHSRSVSVRMIRPDGAIRHTEMTLSPIIYEGDKALLGTVADITDREVEEKRIRQAVIDAQENERREIGMELHDNVKQILAAVVLNLDFAREVIDDKEKSVTLLQRVKEYTLSAITELRRLSHQLAPNMNTDESLNGKIETLIKIMQDGSSFIIRFIKEDSPMEIPAALQLTVYRIIQEQLNNIHRHAKAGRVDIRLQYADNAIQLTVKDDGIGFDPSGKNEGIGLENIRRRVRNFDGSVRIISAPGNGCELFVRIPLKKFAGDYSHK